MNLLVTGGNGFIGSNFINVMLKTKLIDFITNVDAMTAVSSDWIDRVYGNDERYNKVEINICDIRAHEQEIGDQYDFCVHFAAESHVDNSIADVAPFLDTNIRGTYEVAQYCAKAKIPMLHLSTDEVYGHIENATEEPFSVEDPLKPRNPYSASKAAAEHMLDAYANVNPEFEYYVVRPSNNYGPHQDATKFLPKLIQSLYTSTPFPMYGQGDYYREWTHVEDTVLALAHVIKSAPHTNGKRFNISSSEIRSNIEMFFSVLELMRSRKIDTQGHINFIKCPRGNAHDKIYSIENTVHVPYRSVDEGLETLVNDFFDSENGAE